MDLNVNLIPWFNVNVSVRVLSQFRAQCLQILRGKVFLAGDIAVFMALGVVVDVVASVASSFRIRFQFSAL